MSTELPIDYFTGYYYLQDRNIGFSRQPAGYEIKSLLQVLMKRGF